MKENEPTPLSPMPNMSSGYAVGSSSVIDDKESGKVTRRNVMAQYSIPSGASIIIAIDSMEDKKAQDKIIKILEQQQQHNNTVLDRAQERAENREDKKAAEEAIRKKRNQIFTYAFCSLFALALLAMAYMDKIGTTKLVTFLGFLLLLSLGLNNGSIVNLRVKSGDQSESGEKSSLPQKRKS